MRAILSRVFVRFSGSVRSGELLLTSTNLLERSYADARRDSERTNFGSDRIAQRSSQIMGDQSNCSWSFGT